MADAVGIGRPFALPATAAAAPVQGMAAAASAEILAPVPPLPPTNFTATVIERSAQGALLLSSAYGALALKTAQPVAPGTKLELRVIATNPPTVTLQPASPAAEEVEPPLQLDLGTTVTATVVTAAPGGDALPAGTRLELRVAPAPAATSQAAPTDSPAPEPGRPAQTSLLPAGAPDETVRTGTIATGPAGETMIESTIGALVLDQRLALPAGSAITFVRIGAVAPEPAEPAPSSSPASGLPALDQALAALDKAAPAVAQQLHATLAPATAPALAGTLLFLMGALYRGAWPGEAVSRALTAAGHDKLRQKLGADMSELGRLSKDRATGDWQVLTLPLMTGAVVEPLRLYVRRGGDAPEAGDDGTRFVLEAELSRLGALQLDGLVRQKRLDVVLRSHTPLPAELRDEAAGIFRSASAAQGFAGEIVFATAAQFSVAPLAAMRQPVQIKI
jgi:hypothetical protein